MLFALNKLYGYKKILTTLPYYFAYSLKVPEFYHDTTNNPLEYINLLESGNLTFNAKAL